MVRRKNGFGERSFRRKGEQRADCSEVTSDQEVRQGADNEYKQCFQSFVCEQEESVLGLLFLCFMGVAGDRGDLDKHCND